MKTSWKFLLATLIGGCAGFVLCYATLIMRDHRAPVTPRAQTVALRDVPKEPLLWQPKRVLPVLPPKVAGQ